ncbi:MAG: hypothetical protein ACE368_11030 [Paracoccaceae bacterium]
MRLSVFHYPLKGWTDAVAMNMLMGRAVTIQLEELARVSYQPLAEAFRAILPVERRHAEPARAVCATGRDRTPGGKRRRGLLVSKGGRKLRERRTPAVNRSPAALRPAGKPNAALLADWQGDMSSTFSALAWLSRRAAPPATMRRSATLAIPPSSTRASRA